MDLPAPALLRVFPRVWLSGVMEPAAVGEYCGDYEPAAAGTYAAMGFGWPAPKLERLIVDATAFSDRPESWKVPRGSWRMVLYRATDSSDCAPVGMVAFRPVLYVSRSTKKISRCWLTIDLLWITPTARGQGYGKHLVAHLLRYLASRDLATIGHDVARRGVQMVVHAEIHSHAARHLVALVYEFYELQREMKVSGEVDRSMAWQVGSAEFVDE